MEAIGGVANPRHSGAMAVVLNLRSRSNLRRAIGSRLMPGALADRICYFCFYILHQLDTPEQPRAATFNPLRSIGGICC